MAGGLLFVAIGVGIWHEVLTGAWPWVGLRTLFGLFAMAPLGFVFIILSVIGLVRGGAQTIVYENGAEFRRRNQRVVIPFNEVTSCCYHEYAYGQLGTATLELRAQDERKIQIRYDYDPTEPKDMLVKLKPARALAQRITALVRQRFEAKLAGGRTIPWVDNWCLTLDGLVQCNTGSVLRWEAVHSAQFEKDGDKCICTIDDLVRTDVQVPDFWPGYQIVQDQVSKAAGVELDSGILSVS